MAVEKIAYSIFTCDCCGYKKQEIASNVDFPSIENYQSWAALKWDQATGFDAAGSPWASMFAKPLLVCPKCADKLLLYMKSLDPTKKGTTNGDGLSNSNPSCSS